MKSSLKVLLTAGLLAAAGTVHAADSMYWGVRVGPTLGQYKGETAVSADPEICDDLAATAGFTVCDSFEGDFEFSYGLQTGLSAAYGNFFGDLSIEYLTTDFQDADVDRTDILLSGGYLIGQYWSVFGGYRASNQGDGFFDDAIFQESGFFIGAGIGGIEMGPLTFGSSLAYNFSESKDFPIDGTDLDYTGLSLKASLSLTRWPQHSLLLRYQRFSGDDALPLGQDDVNGVEDGIDADNITDSYSLNYELTETYIQLTYLYTFSF